MNKSSAWRKNHERAAAFVFFVQVLALFLLLSEAGLPPAQFPGPLEPISVSLSLLCLWECFNSQRLHLCLGYTRISAAQMPMGRMFKINLFGILAWEIKSLEQGGQCPDGNPGVLWESQMRLPKSQVLVSSYNLAGLWSYMTTLAHVSSIVREYQRITELNYFQLPFVKLFLYLWDPFLLTICIYASSAAGTTWKGQILHPGCFKYKIVLGRAGAAWGEFCGLSEIPTWRCLTRVN